MKVLIYSPYPLDNNSMPVLLDEAAEYLQDPETEVLFLTCGGDLKPCDSNYEGSTIRCAECKFSTALVLKSFSHERFKHAQIDHYVDERIRHDVKSLSHTYEVIDDVKKITHKGINIGLGVVSSYVSMTRNLDPLLSGENRKFIDGMLRSSAILVEAISNIVDVYKPDAMSLFNGRYSGLRPVFEIGAARHITTQVLECTFSSNRQEQRKVKFRNALPHDIDNNTMIIENCWQEAGESPEAHEKAELFFEKRRKAEPASDKVYTQNQSQGLLPENWDHSKRNFVIFNSSEDEFFCVGESFDKYKLFDNQIQGIHHLLSQSRNNPLIHYYLRVHPNLKGIPFRYHVGLQEIFGKYDNITVIDADSPVSTYSLIDHCEKVFVFGSTAGVEASYWGKPVILLGGAFYLHLDVAHYPKSIEELNDCIEKTLPGKPKLGALKYAHFIFGARGERAKYFDFDYSEFSIAGKSLLIPRCYELKGSIVPYLLVLALFRVANAVSHLRFKKITTPKLLVELPDVAK